MLPYRRLIRTEDAPYELSISFSAEDKEEEFLSFGKGQITFWKVFTSEIESITYKDSPYRYGIQIKTKSREYFCPFFSKRGYEELSEVVKKKTTPQTG